MKKIKKNKNNLDEMQEKKLLQIEHNAFWIAFWGLFAAIYIQIAIGNGGFERLGGEIVMMLILSVYLVVSCVKNGIWDRKLKPNFKTNIVISVITGLVVGVFWFFLTYHKYHKIEGSLATGVFMFVVICVLTIVVLSVVTAVYQQRKKKLEDESDDENEE